MSDFKQVLDVFYNFEYHLVGDKIQTMSPALDTLLSTPDSAHVLTLVRKKQMCKIVMHDLFRYVSSFHTG